MCVTWMGRMLCKSKRSYICFCDYVWIVSHFCINSLLWTLGSRLFAFLIFIKVMDLDFFPSNIHLQSHCNKIRVRQTELFVFGPRAQNKMWFTQSHTHTHTCAMITLLLYVYNIRCVGDDERCTNAYKHWRNPHSVSTLQIRHTYSRFLLPICVFPVLVTFHTAYCHSPITFPLHKIMHTIIISMRSCRRSFCNNTVATHTIHKRTTKSTKSENRIILSLAMQSKSSQM